MRSRFTVLGLVSILLVQPLGVVAADPSSSASDVALPTLPAELQKMLGLSSGSPRDILANATAIAAKAKAMEIPSGPHGTHQALANPLARSTAANNGRTNLTPLEQHVADARAKIAARDAAASQRALAKANVSLQAPARAPAAGTATVGVSPHEAREANASTAAAKSDRYVLGFDRLPADITAGSRYHGDLVVEVNQKLGFAVLQTSDAPAATASAGTDPNVRFAESDSQLNWLAAVPNDTLFTRQYAPQLVRAPDAWGLPQGTGDAGNVTLCIVDTGVDFNHPDLAGARYLGGYNAITHANTSVDPNATRDDNGHGTHVAGIATATIGNGLGIAGISNVGYYAVKVLNSSGYGSFTEVAAGIQWCADHATPPNVPTGGAANHTIISMSLGAPVGSYAIRTAIEYAQSRGMIVVAAAGNDGPCLDCVDYPAHYEGVIAVGCTDRYQQLCSFSSSGPEVAVSAPGMKILSTVPSCANATQICDPSGYRAISGTSMSTPAVSGAIALLWSSNLSLTPADIRARLGRDSVDLGATGRDIHFGSGEIDAVCLIQDTSPCLPPDTTPPALLEGRIDISHPWVLKTIWTEQLNASSAPAPADFNVTVDNATHPVSALSLLEHTVRLTLAQPITNGANVTVAYTPGAMPVRDLAGNAASASEAILVDTSDLYNLSLEHATPDAAGYAFNSSLLGPAVQYEWTTLPSDAVTLPLGDDEQSGPIDLPFPVVFYGASHTRLWVCSNGYVTFSPPDDCRVWNGQAIPDPTLPNDLIAGFWSDLDPAIAGAIRYATVGAAPHRTFVVSYENIPQYFGTTPLNSFQIKLHEDRTDVDVDYGAVADASYYYGYSFHSGDTAGIESGNGTIASSYLHGSFSRSQVAVRYTTSVLSIPTAFTIPFQDLIVGEAAQFHDASQPIANSPIASWKWDFGDGNHSTDQDPIHAYATPGKYTVVLNVSDGTHEGSTAREVLVVPTGELAIKTESAVGTTDGTTHFLLGGDWEVVNDVIQAYDPVNNTTRILAARLPVAVTEAASANDTRAAYIFGGYDTNWEPTDAIQRFDFATHTMTVLTTRLPIAVSGASAAFDPTVTSACPQGCFYALGGADAGGDVSPLIFRFDPASGAMTTMHAQLPWGAVFGAAAFAHGAVWFFGGDDVHWNMVDAIERYDPATDTIDIADSILPYRLQSPVALAQGDIIYLAGGYAGSPVWNDPTTILSFDAAHDTLGALAATLPHGERAPAGTLVASQLRVFGGGNNGGIIQNVTIGGLAPAVGPRVHYDPGNASSITTNGAGVTSIANVGSVPADDATLGSGVTVVQAAGAEPAFLQFDGTNNSTVQTTAILYGDQAFAIDATFRVATPPPTGHVMPLFGFTDSQTGPFSLADRSAWIDDTGAISFWNGGSGNLTSGPGYADGHWHRVVVNIAPYGSAAGETLRIDDVPVAVRPAVGSSAFSGHWRLGDGATGSAPPTHLNGSLAGFAVYDHILPPSAFAPVITSATILGAAPSTLTLQISKLLVGSLNASHVSITRLPLSASSPIADPVTSASISGRTLTLTLHTPVAFGDLVQLSYDGAGGLADLQGDPLTARAIAVVNLVPDPAGETSGPDAFGYAFVSNQIAAGPAFSFTDISATGTDAPLLGRNLWTWAIPIGFPFSYYGETVHNVHIAENGFVTLGRAQPQLGASTPTCAQANGLPAIAALETDLTPGQNGHVQYQLTGMAPQRTFIVQWTDMLQLGTNKHVTFQTRLHEDGAIDVAYRQADLAYGNVGDDCTTFVGLSSYAGGSTYRSGATHLTGVQVHFTPPTRIPAFTLSHDVPLAGENTTFTDVSTLPNAVVSRFWDFGDGTNSTDGSPTHAFATAGEFTVRMTTTDGLGHSHVAAKRIVVSLHDVTPPGSLGGATVVGGQIYFMGGGSGVDRLGQPVLHFDPVRGTVVPTEAELPVIFLPLVSTFTATPQGALFTDVFGSNIVTARGLEFLANVEDFDVASMSVYERGVSPWIAILSKGTFDPRPTPACPHGCSYYTGGIGFAVQQGGGADALNDHGSAWLNVFMSRYSPGTNAWTQMSAVMPEEFVYATVNFGGDAIYLTGGYGVDGSATNAIARYDPLLDHVTIPAKTPDRILLGNALWTGEQLFTFGGIAIDATTQSGSLSGNISAYDPYGRVVLPLPPMAPLLFGGESAFDGHTLYLFQGFNATSASNRVVRIGIPAQSQHVDVTGNAVTITYASALNDSTPPSPNDFIVTAAGTPVNVASVSVAGDAVLLTLASPVVAGQDVRVSYTPNASTPMQDAAGTTPLGYTAHPTQNHTPPPAPTIGTTPTVPDGLGGWFVTAPNATVTGMGTLLTCAGAACTPDTPYSGPITLGEGTTILRAQSVLNGIPSAVSEATIRVDLTPPTATPAGDSGTLPGDAATIIFAFSEPMDVSSATAALNGTMGFTTTWNNASTAVTLSAAGLSVGDHVLTIGTGAMDAHGQHLGAPASRNVTVSPPPPPPPPSAPPPQLPGAPTSLSVTNAVDHIHVSWALPTNVGTSPVASYHLFRRTTEGRVLLATVTGTSYDDSAITGGTSYAYSVAAVTAVGEGPSSGEAATSLPLAAAPTSSLALVPGAPDGANGWYLTSPTANLTANPADAHIRYHLDTATDADYSGPVTMPVGSHVLHWHAEKLGAASEADHARSVKVDLAAPTFDDATLGASHILLGGSTTITVHAHDDASGIASVQAVVGGATIPLSGSGTTFTGTLAPRAIGSYTVDLVITDQAGRQTHANGGTFTVDDQVAPSASSEPGSGTNDTLPPVNPTGASGSSSGGTSAPGGSGGTPLQPNSITPTQSTTPTASGSAPPAPVVVVTPQNATIDLSAGARGALTITVQNAVHPENVTFYAIGDDGSVTKLGSGSSATWDTTANPDGYYTVEAREKKDGGTTLTIASARVLVRNTFATAGAAAGSIALGVGAAAATTIVTNAITQSALGAASNAATSSVVSSGSSSGLSFTSYIKDLFIDAGSDTLRNRTKDVASLERRRKIKSAIAIVVTVALIAVFYSIAQAQSIQWSAVLAQLPFVGVAAIILAAQKYSTESIIAHMTGVHVRFRLWVAGVLSLVASTLIFHEPFGYPGYVDNGDEETESEKRLAGHRALAVLGSTAGWGLVFVAIAHFGGYSLGSVGLAMAVTVLATSAMPFGPLPGAEVWCWNKLASIGVALVALAIYITYQMALLPEWTYLTIGAAGTVGYVFTTIHYRNHRKPPHRVPVRDADAQATAEHEARGEVEVK